MRLVALCPTSICFFSVINCIGDQVNVSIFLRILFKNYLLRSNEKASEKSNSSLHPPCINILFFIRHDANEFLGTGQIP